MTRYPPRVSSRNLRTDKDCSLLSTHRMVLRGRMDLVLRAGGSGFVGSRSLRGRPGGCQRPPKCGVVCVLAKQLLRRAGGSTTGEAGWRFTREGRLAFGGTEGLSACRPCGGWWKKRKKPPPLPRDFLEAVPVNPGDEAQEKPLCWPAGSRYLREKERFEQLAIAWRDTRCPYALSAMEMPFNLSQIVGET
jgi:hypothetical protein